MKRNTLTTSIPLFASLVLLAMLAVWPVRADFQSNMLSLNPIGYWRFDEAATSPPLDMITNASALGSVANGFCVGGPVKAQPGIIGNCIQFVNTGNNVGAVNTKIDVPWNAALNPNPPFSVELWAKPNSLGGDATGFSPLENFDPNTGGGASRAGWLFYINSAGRWQFRLGNRAGYAGLLTASSGNAVPGVWQHIVVTWDGTNSTMYANGAVIGTAAISVGNWVNNPQSFIRFGGTPLTGNGAEANYISAQSNNGNRGFDGWLEQVAIYPYLLSPAKVSAHYSAATTNTAGYVTQILGDSPAGYWPLQDAPVTVPTGPFPVAVNIGTLGSAANGTNYWGTLSGQPGPGYAGLGAGDKAVFFDGDTGYCQINDTPGLHWAVNDGSTQNYITMCAWIKPTEQDFFRNIISHGWDVNKGDYAETFLRISPGVGVGYGDGNYYEVGASDGTTFYDSAIVPIPPGDIGNWVFIVGTYDGANWNLYRNGVLAATIPANMGNSDQPNGPTLDTGWIGAAVPSGLDTGAYDVTNWWTIGSRGTDSAFFGQEMSFGGAIDEPAIFTNALTAGQILGLYNAAQVPPVITQGPQNPGTVFTGAQVPFSVWADGNATLAYLWLTNGVSTGVTGTNYTLNASAAGAYTVAVVVSNPYGTNTPLVAFNVINAPPSITAQPAPQVRFVGFPFSFSVGAAGTTPLSYYWRLGNTVVQSGGSSNYTAVASLADAGNYTVIVSNLTGITVTSAPAALVVKPVTASYSGQIVSNNPVAYYRLDETNGSVECFDSVGGHNGTYYSTTLGVPGFSALDSDTAATFNGLNSYVGNIDGTQINFTGHTNFTLEAWVNAPAGQADQASIIAKGIGNNGTTETEQFALDVSGGTYRFFATLKGTVYAAAASDGPNGTWQHVVGVYDDSGSGFMTIYVNGVAEGSTAVIAGGLNSTVSPVSIGSKRTGNDPNYDGTFNGTIDEVAIYNRALTAPQVYADYAAAYGSTLPPVITLQPSPATNYAGLPLSLTVSAYGSIPLTYQWYKGATPLTDGGEYSGSSSHTLTISPGNTGDTGSYSVLITNVAGRSNSVAVSVAVLAPPSSPPDIPGLVMHLTFDDSLTDVTGRGNGGTGTYVHNSAVDTNQVYAVNALTAVTNQVAPAANSGINPNFCYVPDGKVGSALHFSTAAVAITNGSSIGTNDYFVGLGVRPDLQFGSNDFTVSYWIRTPLGYQGGDLPFFTDADQSTGNNGFVFTTSYGYGTANSVGSASTPNWAGSWGLSIIGGGAGIFYYGSIPAGAEINDGQWHNLVHVADHTSNKLITYLDGLVSTYYPEAPNNTLNAAGNINVATQAVIGQDPTGQYGETGAFDMDDLGVWNRALTPLEAAAIFTAGASNQLSFTSPFPISIARTNGTQLVITWPVGTLQATTNVSIHGSFTNVPGAVSPYIFTPGAGSQFYRVKQQ